MLFISSFHRYFHHYCYCTKKYIFYCHYWYFHTAFRIFSWRAFWLLIAILMLTWGWLALPERLLLCWRYKWWQMKTGVRCFLRREVATFSRHDTAKAFIFTPLMIFTPQYESFLSSRLRRGFRLRVLIAIDIAVLSAWFLHFMTGLHFSFAIISQTFLFSLSLFADDFAISSAIMCFQISWSPGFHFLLLYRYRCQLPFFIIR